MFCKQKKCKEFRWNLKIYINYNLSNDKNYLNKNSIAFIAIGKLTY